MPRSRLCRICKDFHDLDAAWPEPCARHFGETTSGLQIISDGMAPIRSMADGRMYDSKSQYRRELKARNCVEVGNERVSRTTTAPQVSVRESMRRSIQQLGG